jgi:hypothetical protein
MGVADPHLSHKDPHFANHAAHLRTAPPPPANADRDVANDLCDLSFPDPQVTIAVPDLISPIPARNSTDSALFQAYPPSLPARRRLPVARRFVASGLANQSFGDRERA